MTVLFIACKKKETLQKDTETQTLIDNALAEQEFMAILPGVIQGLVYINGNSANLPASNSCDSIILIAGDTLDFKPNPVFLLSFGGSNCSRFMPDGKTRSGSVSIRLTGLMKSPGTQIILKLYNYQSEGLNYSCDSVLLTTLEFDASHFLMNAKISNGRCLTGDDEIKYQCDKVLGVSQQKPLSDGFTSTYSYGKASGSNRFGINYFTNAESTDPIIMMNTCPYFQKGFQEITNEGELSWMVNYGDNFCDDLATYYIYENIVEFKLK